MSLQILETVSSTMDIARENLLAGRVAFDGQDFATPAGVLAREQTGGRGQRGRVWYAPKDESLSVTYYFRHGLPLPEAGEHLAFLVGVAVAEVLGHSVGLKWPNDLILQGKKVGGILIEMVKVPEGEWVALIGIGVNLAVSPFPPELTSSATSLLLEGIASQPPEVWGERIAEALQNEALQYRAQGFESLLTRWRALDKTLGRRYQAEEAGETVQGIAVGIDSTGRLLLQRASGNRVAVRSATSLTEIPI